MDRSRTIGRVAAAGVAAALLLAACSGDDDTGGTDTPGDDAPAALPGFEGCADDPNECNVGERADGGSITWVVVALPGAWTAYSPEGGSIYTLQMLNGIFPYTGQYMPDGATYKYNMDLLAEEPELLSEDPFSYQFKFREEAVWDDGTPISADDWIVSWKLGTSEEAGHCVGCRSRSAEKFDAIESVEGSDDGKTITVTLKEGETDPEWFAFFSAHAIGGGLMPAHVAEQQGFDVDNPEQLGEYFEWLNANMPTFSGGPLKLVEGDLENQVIKEPNEAWYGEVQPTLDTTVIRFLDDQGTWVSAMSNREIHGAAPIQLNEDIIRGVEELPGVNVHVGPGPSWEHLDFNMDVPAFEDVALRKAIFTAVDTADVAERNFGALLDDYTLRTNHTFQEGSPYHVDLLEGTGYGTGDTEAALAILDEAGYEFDGTTLTKDGEQVGPFRLRSTADPARVTATSLIQSYLAEIGVEITIETTDDLGATLGEQDYDIMLFGWSGSPLFTVNPAQQWQTGSGSNFGQYSNPEVDELVTQASSGATSLEESADLANQAGAIVVEDAYVLPLWDSPVYVFADETYVNIRDNPASSLRAVYEHHSWGLAAE